MPRPRTKAQQTQQPAPSSNGETTSGYFRRIFREDRTLLKQGTNAAVLERWLQDHPGHKAVPDNIKAILHNLKIVLRTDPSRPGRRAALSGDGRWIAFATDRDVPGPQQGNDGPQADLSPKRSRPPRRHVQQSPEPPMLPVLRTPGTSACARKSRERRGPGVPLNPK